MGRTTAEDVIILDSPPLDIFTFDGFAGCDAVVELGATWDEFNEAVDWWRARGWILWRERGRWCGWYLWRVLPDGRTIMHRMAAEQAARCIFDRSGKLAEVAAMAGEIMHGRRTG